MSTGTGLDHLPRKQRRAIVDAVNRRVARDIDEAVERVRHDETAARLRALFGPTR